MIDIVNAECKRFKEDHFLKQLKHGVRPAGLHPLWSCDQKLPQRRGRLASFPRDANVNIGNVLKFTFGVTSCAHTSFAKVNVDPVVDPRLHQPAARLPAGALLLFFRHRAEAERSSIRRIEMNASIITNIFY